MEKQNQCEKRHPLLNAESKNDCIRSNSILFFFASLLFHEEKKTCTRFGEGRGGAIDKNGPKCGRLEENALVSW